MQGCDTPATRRQRASHGAKPPPLPVSSALQGPRARMGHRWVAEARQLNTRKVPRRNKSRPARAARPNFRYKTLPAYPPLPHVRYKTLPACPPSPHFRYKTLPACPPSPHFRYKTLPAHPKWLDLAQSTHAGRVLYRFHHQEAEQGEFCTERKAEMGLATTAHQAPPVWRVPEGPVWRAPEGPVWRAPEGPEGTGGLRGTEPGRGASG